MKNKKEKAITLIALVITIIILLILAGVTIMTLTGENGLLGKSQKASSETDEKTATEIMNLKITNIQIASYTETQQLPTLKYLATELEKDREIAYVNPGKKKVASISEEGINLDEYDSIYTKLEAYPYEFEINGSLQLASINGKKVADTTTDDLRKEIDDLKLLVQGMQEENQNMKNRINTLENESILNKRIKLTKDDFTPVVISLPNDKQIDQKYASIDLKDTESIRQYKYLEFQIDIGNKSNQYWGEKSIFVETEHLNYNDSDTINWYNDSVFVLNQGWIDDAAIGCYFRNERKLIVGSAGTGTSSWTGMRIRNIYGIK